MVAITTIKWLTEGVDFITCPERVQSYLRIPGLEGTIQDKM